MTAISLKHAFVSGLPASNDAAKVDGPKWDAEHELTQTGAGILGAAAPGDTVVLTSAQVFTALGVSAYIQTLLDDATAAAARATLGVPHFGGMISVMDPTYGAVGNGIANDTAAFIAATAAAASAGVNLLVPKGTYLWATATTWAIPDGMKVDMRGATISKGVNLNPLFTLGNGAEIFGGRFVGNGATYTGRGLSISDTADHDQRLWGTDVTDFSSYNVEISPNAGLRFYWQGGFTQRTTAANESIRVAGGGGTETAGERKFIGLQTGGGNLIDTGGSQNTHLIGCSCLTITMNADAVKTIVSGCRLATVGADLTVAGTEHSITGNIIAGGITIASGATLNRIGPNTLATDTITDNSGNGTNQLTRGVVGGPGATGQLNMSNGTTPASYQYISGLTEDTSPDTANDFLLTYDASATAHKKVKPSNLGLSGGGIANDAVTFAKMQNIATDSLIGRDTASTGDPENILLNATLSMDGSGNLQRAALTGDVTASAGSNTTSLANIPTATPMAGSLLATNIAAPSTPASGKSSIYVDSTQKILTAINDAGVKSIGIVSANAVSNQFVTNIGAGGAQVMAQPAFSNLSGIATLAQVPSSTRYDNLVINGGMEVSQENGTTSTAVTSGVEKYLIDQWILGFTSAVPAVVVGQQIAPPATAVPGYPFCLQMKATTADASLAAGEYFYMRTPIEGTRCGKLAFGGASAQSVTIGFWVYATATGTCSVSLRNSAANRSYVANVTISASNTWEYKTVTIAGDTSGTWLTTTGTGLHLGFCFGGGSNYQATVNTWSAGNFFATSSTSNFFATNNNVVCLTGVTLWAGTDVPTSALASLMQRPFAEELQACMRYYQVLGSLLGFAVGTTEWTGAIHLGIPVRTGSVTLAALGGGSVVTITDTGADYSQSSFSATTTAFGVYGGHLRLANFTGLTSAKDYVQHGTSGARISVADRL